jgi:hypothetical protein
MALVLGEIIGEELLATEVGAAAVAGMETGILDIAEGIGGEAMRGSVEVGLSNASATVEGYVAQAQELGGEMIREAGLDGAVEQVRALETAVTESRAFKTVKGLGKVFAGVKGVMVGAKSLAHDVGEGAKEVGDFLKRARDAIGGVKRKQGSDPEPHEHAHKAKRHKINAEFNKIQGLFFKNPTIKTNALHEGSHHALPHHHSLLGYHNERTSHTSSPQVYDTNMKTNPVLDH